MNPTQPTDLAPEREEQFRRNYAAFADLAARYSQDPELRSRIDSGDVDGPLTDLGIRVPTGVEAKIVANTADTFHLVLPPNPNTELGEEALGAVAGGGKTVGSTGTVGTAVSTISTAGTAGSASPN